MEIEENNELNPGYLGKNIEGHEEEYSSQAWSNIESKLKERRKRRFAFWWFGGIGMFALVLGLVFFLQKPNDENIASNSNIFSNPETPQNNTDTRTSTPEKPEENSKTTINEPFTEKESHQTSKESKALKQKNSPGEKEGNEESASEITQTETKKTAGKSVDPTDKNLSEVQLAQTVNAENEDKVTNENEIKNKNQIKDKNLKTRNLQALLFKNKVKYNGKKETLNISKEVSKPSLSNETSNQGTSDKNEKSLVTSRKQEAKSRLNQTPALEKEIQNPSEVKPALAKAADEKPAFKEDDPARVLDDKIKPTENQSAINAAGSGPDSIMKKQVAIPTVLDSNRVNVNPDSTEDKQETKKRFWLFSVHGGSMTQNASVGQNNDPEFKNYRFQINDNGNYAPTVLALRINHFWQIHKSISVGLRLSYSYNYQRMQSKLESALYAPVTYKQTSDPYSFEAVTVNQDSRTLFARTSHMLEPGLVAKWRPEWSPIGLQFAAQWLGFNLVSGKNLISGDIYQNLQLHSGLFLPINERVQILAETYFIKSDDYYLPLPVRTKGSGWVGTIGIGFRW